MVLRKVSAGHPDNGVHVAFIDNSVPPPSIIRVECGRTIRGALWLRKSPVTCNECKVAVVTKARKERASASTHAGTQAAA